MYFLVVLLGVEHSAQFRNTQRKRRTLLLLRYVYYIMPLSIRMWVETCNNNQCCNTYTTLTRVRKNILFVDCCLLFIANGWNKEQSLVRHIKGRTQTNWTHKTNKRLVVYRDYSSTYNQGTKKSSHISQNIRTFSLEF